LIFLILDPRFIFHISKKQDLSWNLYIDKSLSMAYHSKPSLGSLISGIDQIINKINEKKINSTIFRFGTDLDTNWIYGEKKFLDGSTNLGIVMDHIKYKGDTKSAGSIIITDGQANLGREIPLENLDQYKPIHIIGVGNIVPFVDVAIQSIDAPPVIIKGDNAEIIVSITCNGDIDQKLNITLSSDEKLLGSKVISASANGSLDKVRFMVTPDQTGKMEYRLKVNAIADEVNILNNRQNFSIQVLKDIYRIAIITGVPNFNTQFLKNIINDNAKVEFDHFVYRSNGYSNSLKNFWDTKYDLIIFDNHPIMNNAEEWQSYLRIFAKKILSQKTSLVLFPGYDIEKEVFESYLKLMDLNYKESIINIGDEYKWSLTKDWESFFPFIDTKIINNISNNQPPIYTNLDIDPVNSQVLANFSISEMDVPLLLISEKSPLRFGVWTSPDLNKLYYKNQNGDSSSILNTLFRPVFSWLIRTGEEKNFYFRVGKNSYQQGERITVIGKPINHSEISKEGYIHIYKNDSLINSKQLYFDNEKGIYTGNFWASKSGILNYEIELFNKKNSIIVSRGEVRVQESQIELNNIFLNKFRLQKLADLTNGSFRYWDERLSLVNNINPEIEKTMVNYNIVLKENKWLIIFLILVITIDWILRKRYGIL
tara:strand:- start:1067 stop:3025 length:1959 start_codon:yes stop_codon:yes gene_type:complete